MSENPFLAEQEPASSRPGLLSVLCVLSFVFTGWIMVVGGIRDLFKSREEVEEELAQTNIQFEAQIGEMDSDQAAMLSGIMDGFSDFFSRGIENRYFIAIMGIFLGIVSLYGVWLMWKMQRKGFQYYTLSKLLILLIPFVFYGVNVISVSWTAFAAVITAIMIALYASQRKYMI